MSSRTISFFLHGMFLFSTRTNASPGRFERSKQRLLLPRDMHRSLI